MSSYGELDQARIQRALDKWFGKKKWEETGFWMKDDGETYLGVIRSDADGDDKLYFVRVFPKRCVRADYSMSIDKTYTLSATLE